MDRCGGACLSAHASLPQSHPRGAAFPEAVKVEVQAQTVMPSVKKQTLTRCGTSKARALFHLNSTGALLGLLPGPSPPSASHCLNTNFISTE